jgi:mercuric reductase
MAKQTYDFDVIILGSGGGGSVAAHILAGAGKRVAIAEPEDIMGGGCPNWACVPTKALLQAAEVYDAAKRGQQFGIRAATLSYNYPSIKAWKDLVVKRTGTDQSEQLYESENIKVLHGAGHFISPHEMSVDRRHYSAENFIIATGSHSVIPPIDGLQKAGYLTYKEAINLTRPPRSLMIVGGGAVGCEFAELFSVFGTKVHISEVSSRLLVKEDEEAGDLLREVFEAERGMQVLTNTKVIKIEKEGLAKRVHYQQGSELKSVKVDEVLIAAGKAANVDIGLENAGVEYSPHSVAVNEFTQTSAKHIYAAGDVAGPYQFTHTAIYQSRLAAHNILNGKQRIAADYRAVPRCTFVWPEIASVGLSEEECVKRDLRIKKALAPISIISRANTANMEQGFVKVITRKDNTIIGATIASPRAGEMIHELTLAIQHELTAADVAGTIHAFPTWSEAVRTACSKVLRTK